MVIVAVFLAGCTQPSAPVATPSPTPTTIATTVETLPPATQAPAVQKQIDISATQVGSDVVVRYRGGVNAGDVSALDITIVNSRGVSTNERETSPVTGQEFIFPKIGTAELDKVTVIGIFRDGSEQTILTTQV
jgi:hypothetical protein